MSLSNIRSYTYQVSLTCLPEHKLNRDDSNRHAKADGEKKASTIHKELRQLRNTENGRIVFPRE